MILGKRWNPKYWLFMGMGMGLYPLRNQTWIFRVNMGTVPWSIMMSQSWCDCNSNVFELGHMWIRCFPTTYLLSPNFMMKWKWNRHPSSPSWNHSEHGQIFDIYSNTSQCQRMIECSNSAHCRLSIESFSCLSACTCKLLSCFFRDGWNLMKDFLIVTLVFTVVIALIINTVQNFVWLFHFCFRCSILIGRFDIEII